MHIKLDKFEGPLQFLLQMIEQRKLDISEINLLQVTDQYLDYLKSSPDIDPDHLADFLVVASKLLLLKAKSLLPYLSPEEEEEITEFTEQLKMYQEFLQAAKMMADLLNRKRFMFSRQFDRQSLLRGVKFFWPPAKLTPGQLARVMREIIAGLVLPETLALTTVVEEIKLEERISFITVLLTNKLKLFFSHLIRECASKTEVIVNFLAVLE